MTADDDVEQRLCDALEPVLIRYGIPAYGLPLHPSVSSKLFVFADGQGDRGDLTSDLASAARMVIQGGPADGDTPGSDRVPGTAGG